MTNTSIDIRCQKCDLTAARIEGKELVVECRHYGKKHVSRYALAELLRMAESGADGVYVKGVRDG